MRLNKGLNRRLKRSSNSVNHPYLGYSPAFLEESSSRLKRSIFATRTTFSPYKSHSHLGLLSSTSKWTPMQRKKNDKGEKSKCLF